MPINQKSKDLISGGIWASGDDADRSEPEDYGLVRSTGWTVPYEQRGAGREPERDVFNQRDFEIDSAIFDCFNYGVLPWDPEVDYPHDENGASFVTTDSSLWVSNEANGPRYGNATDPVQGGQTIWRRY